MPIWSIGSIATEPEVSLVRWRVLEVDDGTRHFVGLSNRDLSGRVSSAIVKFDLATQRGTTLSSRVYQLLGDPGHADNADYVWEAWCVVNKVKSFTDVTKQVLFGAADGALE